MKIRKWMARMAIVFVTLCLLPIFNPVPVLASSPSTSLLTVLAEDQYGNNLTTGDVYIDDQWRGLTGSNFLELGTRQIFVNDFWESGNTGYRYCFQHWEDGSTENPRTITVNEDTTIKAHFYKKYCLGDVDGDCDVDVGDQRNLQLAMFSQRGDPNWDSRADVHGDGDVDVGDQRIVALRTPAGNNWLSGWSFRKAHDITGSTFGNSTDHQVRIKVHYGTGTDSGENVYLNYKSYTGIDVRFTADDGTTLLDYFVEERTDEYTIFWVKIPSIPESPDTCTIYIYYGNYGTYNVLDLMSVNHTWTEGESWDSTQRAIARSLLEQFGYGEWVKHPDNPLITIGEKGSWDETGIAMPDVHRLNASDFRMLFQGTRGASPTHAIGYATSPDGINWTKHDDNPVISAGDPGAWDDERACEHGLHIEDDGTLNVWYTGYDESLYKFGLATSTNWTSWTKDASNPVFEWPTHIITSPKIIKEGSTYKMWYVGYGDLASGSAGIRYAASTNKIEWTDHGYVITPGAPGEWDSDFVEVFDVSKIADLYICFYEATKLGESPTYQRFGLAWSTDGTTWTKHPNNPILDVGDSGEWDAWRVIHPHVIFVPPNTFYLYYSGAPDEWGTFKIGLARLSVTSLVPESTEDTFVFYDDFDSWGTSKWGSQPDWATLSDGICSLEAQNADHYLYSQSTFGLNVKEEILARVAGDIGLTREIHRQRISRPVEFENEKAIEGKRWKFFQRC